MILCRKFQFLDCAMMKTACTSKRATFRKSPYDAVAMTFQHRQSIPSMWPLDGPKELRIPIDKDEFLRMCTVRHPFDRASSMYFYCLGIAQGGRNGWRVHEYEDWIEGDPGRFFQWLYVQMVPTGSWWAWSADEYLSSFDPHVLMRYERLDEAYETLFTEQGWPVPSFGVANLSRARDRAWDELIDEPMRAELLTYPFFQREFAALQYLPDQLEHPDGNAFTWVKER